MLNDEQLEHELATALHNHDALTYFCLTLEQLRRTIPHFSAQFAWGYKPSWLGRYVERLNQDPFPDTLKPLSVLTPHLAEILTQELPGYGKSLWELDGAMVITPEGILHNAFLNYRVDPHSVALAKKLSGEHLAQRYRFKHQLADIGTGTIRSKAVSYLFPAEGIAGRVKSNGLWYLFNQGQTVLCSVPSEEEGMLNNPWKNQILKLRELLHQATIEVRLKSEVRVKEPSMNTTFF